MKRKGESVLRESNPSSLDTFSARIIPEWNFFQRDTFLGFGCNATAVSDAGIRHDSSSESTEVPVGRVKLISFDDITTKLGPILRSARNIMTNKVTPTTANKHAFVALFAHDCGAVFQTCFEAF